MVGWVVGWVVLCVMWGGGGGWEREEGDGGGRGSDLCVRRVCLSTCADEACT